MNPHTDDAWPWSRDRNHLRIRSGVGRLSLVWLGSEVQAAVLATQVIRVNTADLGPVGEHNCNTDRSMSGQAGPVASRAR